LLSLLETHSLEEKASNVLGYRNSE
jgi:hypothetical protein